MAINTATKLNKQSTQAKAVGIRDHVKTERTKPQHLLKRSYKAGEEHLSKEKQLQRNSKELPQRRSRLFLSKTSKLKNKMSLISEEGDLPPCQPSTAQTQQSVLKNLLGDSDSATASAATLSSVTANKTKRIPSVPKGFGARALWEQLQKESMRKLLAMDEKIPLEWKRSYGAYIRDSINRKRPIIFRNFTQHEDVKDIDRLLDNSYQERVKKVRHHTNLMFRSSAQNKNRTDILLGRVGDNSNMLSAASLNPDEPTMERYFSNLRVSKAVDNDDSECEEVTNEPGFQLSIGEKDEEEAGQQHRPAANLLFLTEIESGAESSSFRDKFSGSALAPTGCGAVRQVTDVPGFHSKQPRQLPPTAPPLTMRHHHHHHLPPLPHTTQGGARARKGSVDPEWQPLTLGALMDYSEKRRAHGQGRFRYGSVQHWHRSQASSV